MECDGRRRLVGQVEVLPYFKKSEDFEEGASEYHGAGGPLSVRVCPDDVMRSEHFLNAAVELGFDGPRWDYNGARQENGAGFLQFHITKKGTRATSGVAFLAPIADRKNLTSDRTVAPKPRNWSSREPGWSACSIGRTAS